MRWRRECLFLLGLMALTLASFAGWMPEALADKTDSDLVPPDVTLTTSQQAIKATTEAPGMSSGAGSSAVPGMAAPTGTAVPGAAAGTGQPKPPAAGSSAFLPTTSKLPQNKSGMFLGSGDKPDPNKPDPIATMETSKGTIKIMLFRRLAPLTVENFVDLVGRGFYNGLTFCHVDPGIMVLGGDPNGNGMGLYVDPESKQPRFLPFQLEMRLKHNAPGVIGMWHFGKSPNSASCTFYITLSPQPSMDAKFAIFGGVVKGMDVVNKLAVGDKIVSVSVEEQQ